MRCSGVLHSECCPTFQKTREEAGSRRPTVRRLTPHLLVTQPVVVAVPGTLTCGVLQGRAATLRTARYDSNYVVSLPVGAQEV